MAPRSARDLDEYDKLEEYERLPDLFDPKTEEAEFEPGDAEEDDLPKRRGAAEDDESRPEGEEEEEDDEDDNEDEEESESDEDE